MSNFIVPNTFVPGTKAKAQEVNENFAAIQDEINLKASKTGDSTQAFLVGTAENSNHAVTLSQMQTAVNSATNTLNNSISKMSDPFVIEKGYVNSSGEPNIIKYANHVISFNIDSGTTYGPLVAVPANKQPKMTITGLSSINISSYGGATYNIFVSKSSGAYLLINKVYIQNTRPAAENNCVFVDVSKKDITAQKYNGSRWEDFNDIYLGQVTITGGAVTSTIHTPFNFNGQGRQLFNKYINGTSFYEIYNEFNNTDNKFVKFCVQGAQVAANAGSATATLAVTFSKALGSCAAPVSARAWVSVAQLTTTTIKISSGAWSSNGLITSSGNATVSYKAWGYV